LTKTLHLSPKEWKALENCIHGELDNDDGNSDPYMNALRRVARKMDVSNGEGRTKGVLKP
jgi:hypothetical protein